jgi:hypothetical protein
MTVYALSVAARRADVAGVVRATCAPDALEIELLRVTAFSSGFAPAGVADPVTFRVPYTAVRGLVREGRLLYVALDPKVVRPYARFALARFTDEPDEILAHAHEARTMARWASTLLPVPLGALAAALVPGALAGGWVGRASVGALAAMLVWGACRGLAALRTWGGPRSDRLRDRFEATLSEHLALAATREVVPQALPRATVTGATVPRAQAGPPPAYPRVAAAHTQRPAAPASRPRAPSAPPSWRSAAIGALVAAVGIVSVVIFLRRYAGLQPPPPVAVRARTGLGRAVRGDRGELPVAKERERCLCLRADSPLWKTEIPILSVLTFESDEGPTVAPTPTLDRKGFPKYRFDLAIVNNGARPLRDIRLTLTFARRTASGKRVGAVDRGLFWSGVLGAGHAAKWHLKAPGNEVRTDLSVTGTLARAHLDLAPADAFFALTSARVRPVRVHGAVMLAYLRDPRADAAARALLARGAADAETLARVRRAAASVIACDVRREGERLDACVWNGASTPKRGLALREVPASPGAPPRSVPIDGAVPVHEGIRVSFDVPADFSDEIAIVDPAAVE